MAELAHLLQANICSYYQYWSSAYGWSWIIMILRLEKRDIFKYFTENNIGIINGDQPILRMFLISIR